MGINMFCVFDTETNDLPLWNQPPNNIYQPHIVQLAAVIFDEEFRMVNCFCTLIKPDGWAMSAGAESKHHISIETCDKFGVPIAVAVKMFEEFLNHAKYAIAHNIKFDARMVDIEMSRLQKDLFDWEHQGICTMLGSTEWCKLPGTRGKYKWPKLEELYLKITGEVLEDAHDALQDTNACAVCFGFLVKNGIIRLDEFIKTDEVVS